MRDIREEDGVLIDEAINFIVNDVGNALRNYCLPELRECEGNVPGSFKVKVTRTKEHSKRYRYNIRLVHHIDSIAQYHGAKLNFSMSEDDKLYVHSSHSSEIYVEGNKLNIWSIRLLFAHLVSKAVDKFNDQ